VPINQSNRFWVPIMNRDMKETNKDKLIFAFKLLATYQGKHTHEQKAVYKLYTSANTQNSVGKIIGGGLSRDN